VFAHAVLQLADQGHLSLDAPLAGYLPGYLPADERASSITARHVLSHSAGLPNWRNADLPLKTYFQPGERFSYSGEGFLYLQKAIEAVTGEKVHTLAERLVLGPFGMVRSSFVWDWRFDTNRAFPHDAFGRPAIGGKPGEGNAAWTLQTTAADFARFLLGVLNGSGLTPETALLWLRPRVEVRHPGIQFLGATNGGGKPGSPGAWAGGWSRAKVRSSTGVTTPPSHRSQSARCRDETRSCSSRTVLLGIPSCPNSWRPSCPVTALHWPGSTMGATTPRSDACCAARTHGVAAVWKEMEEAGFKAAELLWIAQGLDAAGLNGDSLWLREQINRRNADPPQ